MARLIGCGRLRSGHLRQHRTVSPTQSFRLAALSEIRSSDQTRIALITRKLLKALERPDGRGHTSPDLVPYGPTRPDPPCRARGEPRALHACTNDSMTRHCCLGWESEVTELFCEIGAKTASVHAQAPPYLPTESKATQYSLQYSLQYSRQYPRQYRMQSPTQALQCHSRPMTET